MSELGVQITLGSVMGFCSGYALKRTAKVAAVVVGLGFLALQGARAAKLVDVPDWRGAQDALIRFLDVDQDGAVTNNDLRLLLGRVLDSLQLGLPSGAGFAAAFILGLRYG